MWSQPVTFGGGSTMLNGGRSESGLARNAPMRSQKAYHFGSTVACSKTFGSSPIRVIVSAALAPEPEDHRGQKRKGAKGCPV